MTGKVTVTEADGKPTAAGVEVIVYVVGFTEPASATPVTVKQKGRRFVPELDAVTLGGKVTFPNEDAFLHNVFSQSSSRKFDLGSFKKGEAKTKEFPSPGVVDVYCNIHPEMVAKVVVVDGPFWAVTGKDGSFTMAGVPPGTYPLVAYGGDGKEVRTEVTVTVGGTTTAKLEVAKPAAQPHLRKDGTPYGRYK